MKRLKIRLKKIFKMEKVLTREKSVNDQNSLFKVGYKTKTN